MKIITLTRGQITLVDDEDYEYLNQFKWQAQLIGGLWYASRAIYVKETQNTIRRFMHREILNVTDRKIKVDHEDHNGLNNQRSNLRLATHSQNISNQMNRQKGASKYLGVWFHKPTGKWAADITKNYVKKYLGLYINEKDAAIAYNNAAKELHGEFANLNVL